MKNKKIGIIALTLFIAMICVPFHASAASTLSSEYEGTLIVTFPNGEISILEAGDAVPSIPPGSTLEVFEGQFAVESTDGIMASCLEHDILIEAQDISVSFVLECGKYEENRGLLTMISGVATVIKPDGTQEEVTDEIVIYGGDQQEPAPTAQGNPIGLGLDGDVPVDSRSIEASATT